VATSAVSSGSGVLDVNGIVSQLMAAEARPLATYDKKSAAVTATVSAYGSLSAAIGVFQSAIGGLTRGTDFKSLSAAVANDTILSASANSKAVAGSYKVNVTQLAQNQTLSTNGLAAKNTAVGSGAKTTLSFQFGTASGTFGLSSNTLGSAVLSNGIANGALILNGKAIATSAGTNSARALAEAINAQSANSGVTASATAASSAAGLFAGFGAVTTDADSTYTLTVGGVTLMSQGSGESGTIDAAALDAVLAGPSAALTSLQSAGITFTGTAAGEDLVFTRADGSNLSIEEVVTGNVGGVQGGLQTDAAANNGGSSVTTGGGIVLNSASGNPISVAGSNPALAGLTAGTGGSYLSASFNQDGAVSSGTVVIDSTNNTLEGIRDAVNKANIGVTATIVSDGSANPYHLVFTSNNTGANGSMKISLSGAGGDPADAALSDLLSYDPTGIQKMSQTAAGQDTKLEVNGIAVSSHSTSVGEAIQGVTLTVSQLGATSVTINKNAASLKESVNGFVKAYNELSTAIKKLTVYDPTSKTGGPLQGDPTTTSIQAQLRRMLSMSVTGTGGELTTLTQIGVSFERDGTLSLDSSKLSKAIDENFAEIGALFGAISNSTDSQVAFNSSTSKTVPGDYGLIISQMATRGSISSETPVADTTILPDTVWALTVNDTDPSDSKNIFNVNIPAGSYTPTELAKALQSAINGMAKNGARVTASIDDDGKLQIVSNKYGAASNIGLANVSGTAIADLFGTAAIEAGKDVAGTLGGHAAVGNGQTLTGAEGTPVEGLKIDITGGEAGERGTVSFSQGYAYQLNNLATGFLGRSGLIASRTDGLNKSIADIAKQREKFADKLEGIEARYRKQYTALDVTLSQMQTTQQYLSQQLAALAANS